MRNDVRRRRRSMRLPEYDYAAPGACFVTICAHERRVLFGAVVDGEIRMNGLGRIVARCWNAIPGHFPHVAPDAFVVMPNHVHGILLITDPPTAAVGAQHAAPLHRPGQTLAEPRAEKRPPVPPGSLGAIVRSFKSASTRQINRLRGTPGGAVWQRNYYEHIVRNEASLNRLRQYIADNPRRWADDPENPAGRPRKP